MYTSLYLSVCLSYFSLLSLSLLSLLSPSLLSPSLLSPLSLPLSVFVSLPIVSLVSFSILSLVSLFLSVSLSLSLSFVSLVSLYSLSLLSLPLSDSASIFISVSVSLSPLTLELCPSLCVSIRLRFTCIWMCDSHAYGYAFVLGSPNLNKEIFSFSLSISISVYLITIFSRQEIPVNLYIVPICTKINFMSIIVVVIIVNIIKLLSAREQKYESRNCLIFQEFMEFLVNAIVIKNMYCCCLIKLRYQEPKMYYFFNAVLCNFLSYERHDWLQSLPGSCAVH